MTGVRAKLKALPRCAGILQLTIARGEHSRRDYDENFAYPCSKRNYETHTLSTTELASCSGEIIHLALFLRSRWLDANGAR